jgi:fructokinase
VIEASLQLANTLKLNRMELTALAQTFGQKDDEAPRTVEYLCEAFSLQWVALTLGAEGSHVWGDGVDARIQAGTVEVRDSVGAGDAFTAALIVQLLAGKDLVEAATAAGEVGTFVATCDGGMPELPNRFRLFE